MEIKPMIRDAISVDIEALVQLHIRNVHPNELSMILGKPFIRLFYTLALADRETRVKIVVVEGKPVAMSIAFAHFSRFELRFKLRSLFPLALKLGLDLLTLKIATIRHLFKAITSPHPRDGLAKDIYDCHVGLFILDQEFKFHAPLVVLFYKIYKENVAWLKSRGGVGCWGACRVSNPSSYRLLKDMKLTEEIELQAYPERIKVLIYRRHPEKN